MGESRDGRGPGAHPAARGGGRFKAVREKIGGSRSHIKRSSYEKVSTESHSDVAGSGSALGDVFTTNPMTSPVKGDLDDVEIQTQEQEKLYKEHQQ